MVTVEMDELIIRGCMMHKECNKECLRKTVINKPNWFAPFLPETFVNAQEECQYKITDTNTKQRQDELESLFNTI